MKVNSLPNYRSLNPAKTPQKELGSIGFRDLIDGFISEKIKYIEFNRRSPTKEINWNESVVRDLEEGKCTWHSIQLGMTKKSNDEYSLHNANSRLKGLHRGFLSGYYRKEYDENFRVFVEVGHAAYEMEHYIDANRKQVAHKLLSKVCIPSNVSKKLEKFFNFYEIPKAHKPKFYIAATQVACAYDEKKRSITYSDYFSANKQASYLLDSGDRVVLPLTEDIRKSVDFVNEIHKEMRSRIDYDKEGYKKLLTDHALAAFLMVDYLGEKKLSKQGAEVIAEQIMTHTRTIPSYVRDIKRRDRDGGHKVFIPKLIDILTLKSKCKHSKRGSTRDIDTVKCVLDHHELPSSQIAQIHGGISVASVNRIKRQFKKT
jgi:hypothetical protein